MKSELTLPENNLGEGRNGVFCYKLFENAGNQLGSRVGSGRSSPPFPMWGSRDALTPHDVTTSNGICGQREREAPLTGILRTSSSTLKLDVSVGEDTSGM